MEKLCGKLIDLINEQDFCFDTEEWKLLHKALERFKSYEETDLTPEEFKESVEFSLELNKKAHELIKAEEQGRLIVLPEDGMLYYIEENEEDKWIGNRPIMDIVFEYGWGLVGLKCSLRDVGKKVFFSRKEAEAALKR